MNLKAIRDNLGANGLTVLFNTVFQFVSVPIFLAYWGVNLYGDWLVLASLTSYFAMSDIGLNTVTINEFAISYAQKKIKKCNTLFNNNLFFILIVFAVVLSGTLLLLYVINLSSFFKLDSIPERTAETILVCLLIQVFVGMTSGLFDAIYRATNRNATGVMVSNYVRMSENILLIAGVALQYHLITIVIVYSIPRVAGLVFKAYKTRNYFPLSIHTKYFNKQEFKRIIIPAFSFLSFPVGNSIILQGFTLLINFTLGSVAVVIYNTTRTLINFIKVGFNLINSSVWPEFSLAFGRSDFPTMRKLHRYSVSLSFYFSLLASVLLFIFGEFIYTTWTKSKLEFDAILFISFLITLITNTVWYTSSVVLASTNNHKTFSLYYVGSCFISLLLGYFVIKTTNIVSFVPLSLLMIDVFLIFVVLKNSLLIVQDSWRDFFKSVREFPFDLFKNYKKLLKN